MNEHVPHPKKNISSQLMKWVSLVSAKSFIVTLVVVFGGLSAFSQEEDRGEQQVQQVQQVEYSSVSEESSEMTLDSRQDPNLQENNEGSTSNNGDSNLFLRNQLLEFWKK